MGTQGRGIRSACVASIASLALSGCTADTVVGTPLALTFVVARADIPEITRDDVTGEDLAVGMNLDGVVSDGTGLDCTGDFDFRSPVTGAAGVDNQFAAYGVGLLGGVLGREGFAGAISAQLLSGAPLLVFELTGVDSLVEDGLVTVHAFLGHTPSGEPLRVDATGGIATGQAFVVEEDLGTSSGAISSGRLEADIARFPVRFEIDAMPFELPLTSARFSADISRTALTNGEVGASFRVADASAALVALLRWGEIVEPGVTLYGNPDLELDPVSGECLAISTGLVFDAVSATVAP